MPIKCETWINLKPFTNLWHINPSPIERQSSPIYSQSVRTRDDYPTSRIIVRTNQLGRQSNHSNSNPMSIKCQSYTNRKTIVRLTWEQVYYGDRPKCLDVGRFRQSISEQTQPILNTLPIPDQFCNSRPICQFIVNPIPILDWSSNPKPILDKSVNTASSRQYIVIPSLITNLAIHCQSWTNLSIHDHFNNPQPIFQANNNLQTSPTFNINQIPIQCQYMTNLQNLDQSANLFPKCKSNTNTLPICQFNANPSPICQSIPNRPILDLSANILPIFQPLTYISIHRQLASVFPSSSKPASIHSRPSNLYLTHQTTHPQINENWIVTNWQYIDTHWHIWC